MAAGRPWGEGMGELHLRPKGGLQPWQQVGAGAGPGGAEAEKTEAAAAPCTGCRRLQLVKRKGLKTIERQPRKTEAAAAPCTGCVGLQVAREKWLK